MYKYTDEIIDSIIHGFCVTVLIEQDLEDEFFNSGMNYEGDFIAKAYENNKAELRELLDEYFDSGEAEDDLTCGNAEYWRQEFDILNIEDEMMGNEYDRAKEQMINMFGL